jgi:hypothetical protein
VSLKAEAKGIGARLDTQATASKGPTMKLDLRQEFLKSLQGQYLDALNQEERAVIEVSLGEMGNKPDAVKLGWLKMRTKETWTKQRYLRALDRTMKKLRAAVEAESAHRK